MVAAAGTDAATEKRLWDEDHAGLPAEGALIDVSCRTIQGHNLLRPSPELNELVVGVLGHAQSLTAMRICAISVMSSHFHLLLDVDDEGQLSRFMHSVDGVAHSREDGPFRPEIARRASEIAASTGSPCAREP